MYAIIATGGKQYKVAEGDIIRVEKLGVEAGETVTFDQVLAVSNDGLKVGADVENASVTASVIENGKSTIEELMRLEVDSVAWTSIIIYNHLVCICIWIENITSPRMLTNYFLLTRTTFYCHFGAAEQLHFWQIIILCCGNGIILPVFFDVNLNGVRVCRERIHRNIKRFPCFVIFPVEAFVAVGKH